MTNCQTAFKEYLAKLGYYEDGLDIPKEDWLLLKLAFLAGWEARGEVAQQKHSCRYRSSHVRKQ